MREEFGTGFETEEDTLKEKYLAFSLGVETYGIEIRYVTEIIGLQPITEVPELPEYMKGIINLRGKIIPVIDVRLRFRKSVKDYNDRTCVIVVDVKGECPVGLVVDTVAEVLNIPDSNTVPPPFLHTVSQQKYIKAIGKVGEEVILILDIDKILNDEEINNVDSVLRG